MCVIKKEFLKIVGDRYKENFSLSSYTSFKTGGAAKYLVSPINLEEVRKIFLVSKNYNLPLIILGKGTNVLVSDEGFDGVVLLTENLNKLFIQNNKLISESGVRISSLIKTAITNCLGGIEFLAGIPGSVGGAVISNAGLKSLWVSHIIEEIDMVSLEDFVVKKRKKEEISFEYRRSGLENFFIHKVVFNLRRSTSNEIKKTIYSYLNQRTLRQPVGICSAGSVFKNPNGYFAGKLIEEAGLKEYSQGGARVSEKHANFIVATRNAKSQDIYKIIRIIQNKVKELHNINLQLEIKLIGNFEAENK